MVCFPAEKMIAFRAPEVGIFCEAHFSNKYSSVVLFSMAFLILSEFRDLEQAKKYGMKL
jgi:hypothetical protein